MFRTPPYRRYTRRPWIPGLTSADVTVALTGQALAISRGTLVPSNAVPLTGSALTLSLGTLTPALAKALTTQLLTFSQGTLTPSNAVPLTGLVATFSQGTISVNGDVTAALTGQGLTASLGTLLPALDKALTGQSQSLSAGTLVPTTDKALSTQLLTFSQDTLTPTGGAVVVALTGLSLSISQGNLSASGGDQLAQSSGGWEYFFRAEQDNFRKRAKRKKELEDAEEKIEDQIDLQISKLLHDQERKDDERKDLDRLSKLVKRYAADIESDLQVERVNKALKAAEQKQTLAAFEMLQREIERVAEEDEFALFMLLAHDD